MPVHNGGRFLGQALRSVDMQDYRSFEVIVVDDGSTDDSGEIVARHGGVRYIHQENKGVASARNAGIRASNAEVIVFMDSDDTWPVGRLRLTTRYFQEHPEIGYLLGKQMMFVEPGCEAPAWIRPEWLREPQDASNTGTLAVRRAVFDRIGLFNEEVGAEDTEWLVRASEAGVPMARLPDVVLHRRIHGRNLSARLFPERRENLLRIARESIHRRRNRGEGT